MAIAAAINKNGKAAALLTNSKNLSTMAVVLLHNVTEPSVAPFYSQPALNSWTNGEGGACNRSGSVAAANDTQQWQTRFIVRSAASAELWGGG